MSAKKHNSKNIKKQFLLKIFFLFFIILISYLVINSNWTTHKLNSGFRLISHFVCNINRINCVTDESIPLIENNPKKKFQEHKFYLENLQFFEASKLNSKLASNISNSLFDFNKGWLEIQNKETLLIGYRPYWESQYHLYVPEQSGADFFPFLYLSTSIFDNSSFQLVSWWLTKHENLVDDEGLPLVIDIYTNKPILRDLNSNIFGASELVKDGFIPLIEFYGPKHISINLSEKMLTSIFSTCSDSPNFGCIPSLNSEVNGELLISLSRMYMFTKDKKYLNMGLPIYIKYISNVLPSNNYLPCQYLERNFSSCSSNEFSTGDHSNEIVVGLLEFNNALKVDGHNTNNSDFVLIKMLTHLSDFALDDKGFWIRKGKSGKKTPYIDTWGYLHNAYFLANRNNLTNIDFINLSLSNLDNISIYSFAYNLDGVADSIESAIYLQKVSNEDTNFFFITNNLFYLLNGQKKNGMYMKNYKDGNVARTLLLAYFYYTKGTYVVPWNSNISLGSTQINDTLYLYLESNNLWSGTIHFDTPRSKEWTGENYYPRINSWPEWFTINKDEKYNVSINNISKIIDGNSIIKNGINITLMSNQTDYIIIKKNYNNSQLIK